MDSLPPVHPSFVQPPQATTIQEAIDVGGPQVNTDSMLAAPGIAAEGFDIDQMLVDADRMLLELFDTTALAPPPIPTTTPMQIRRKRKAEQTEAPTKRSTIALKNLEIPKLDPLINELERIDKELLALNTRATKGVFTKAYRDPEDESISKPERARFYNYKVRSKQNKLASLLNNRTTVYESLNTVLREEIGTLKEEKNRLAHRLLSEVSTGDVDPDPVSAPGPF